MNFRAIIWCVAIALALGGTAEARSFTSTITEAADITQIRPEFKRPDEPGRWRQQP